MEIILIIVVVGAIWYIVQQRKARAIVRQHSVTLSRQTGIASAQIEREMIERKLTPGEWAREHGLHPITFEHPGNGPPSASSGHSHLPGRGSAASPPWQTPGAERELPEPDWTEVAEVLTDSEVRLAASKGWLVGDEIDVPCKLYLTNQTLHVAIKPDASLVEKPSLESIPLTTLQKSGLATNDMGLPRLVVIHDPTGRRDPGELRGLGVDLRPVEHATWFADQIQAASSH